MKNKKASTLNQLMFWVAVFVLTVAAGVYMQVSTERILVPVNLAQVAADKAGYYSQPSVVHLSGQKQAIRVVENAVVAYMKDGVAVLVPNPIPAGELTDSKYMLAKGLWGEAEVGSIISLVEPEIGQKVANEDGKEVAYYFLTNWRSIEITGVVAVDNQQFANLTAQITDKKKGLLNLAPFALPLWFHLNY